MTPPPEQHGQYLSAKTLQTGNGYRSPQRKLVQFFEKSRNQWKAKCFDAKTTVKGLKNRMRFLERSKQHWKSEVKALREELARMQAKAHARERAIEALKKSIRNTWEV